MSFGPHLLLASLEGLVTAAVLALTALGLSLVFGVMRVVNVAHGEFFMLGAVIAWWVASMAGAHPAIGFALALVVAPLVVGASLSPPERLVLRRLDYNRATIVATIGLLYIIQQAALSLRTGSPPGFHPSTTACSALVQILRLPARRDRRRNPDPRYIARADPHENRPVMRATQYDRETAQASAYRRPRLWRRFRARRDAHNCRGGAHRADPAGALSDGPRPAASLLHRGHHWRARFAAALIAALLIRPVGRHHLHVLLADPRQDDRDAGGALVLVFRPGPVPDRRPMNGKVSPCMSGHLAAVLAEFPAARLPSRRAGASWS